MSTRAPVVAGMFYPGTPESLAEAVDSYLEGADVPDLPPPKAVIAPHAGYPFSAPVAAPAYRLLEQQKDTVKRVLLLGPAHRVPVRGAGLPESDEWETPLGTVPVDTETVTRLAALDGVEPAGRAHAMEHSLEVHLPFLSRVLSDFSLIPVVTGRQAPAIKAAEAILDAVWDDPATVVVISTDLSHYLPYDKARETDLATAKAVESFSPEDIAPHDACGRGPLCGALRVAKRRNMTIHRVALASSGDTRGPREEVVGYGAWAITN